MGKVGDLTEPAVPGPVQTPESSRRRIRDRAMKGEASDDEQSANWTGSSSRLALFSKKKSLSSVFSRPLLSFKNRLRLLLSSKGRSNKFEDEEEARSEEKSGCCQVSVSVASEKSKSSFKNAVESEFAANTTTEIKAIKFKT